MGTKMVSAREIVGRRIVSFCPHPFDGKRGTAHDPTIHLDDGSRLVFVTEETEIGEYGTLILRVKKSKP